jgi:hypothetical protein
LGENHEKVRGFGLHQLRNHCKPTMSSRHSSCRHGLQIQQNRRAAHTQPAPESFRSGSADPAARYSVLRGHRHRKPGGVVKLLGITEAAAVNRHCTSYSTASSSMKSSSSSQRGMVQECSENEGFRDGFGLPVIGPLPLHRSASQAVRKTMSEIPRRLLAFGTYASATPVSRPKTRPSICNGTL